MDAIGHSAGGVAHDFNNLLTIVNGYSAMSSTSYLRKTPAHEMALKILKAANRPVSSPSNCWPSAVSKSSCPNH